MELASNRTSLNLNGGATAAKDGTERTVVRGLSSRLALHQLSFSVLETETCLNHCNNQGSCEKADESHSTWWCNCKQGWNGANCGTRPVQLTSLLSPLCTSFFFLSIDTETCLNNCSNHGTCEPADSSHSTWWCNCDPGFSGANC